MKLTELYKVHSIQEAIELLENNDSDLVEFIDHEDSVERDDDHGTWQDRFIVKQDNKFYEILIEYFDYGDVDYDNKMYLKDLIEVYPKEIKKIIYVRHKS